MLAVLAAAFPTFQPHRLPPTPLTPFPLNIRRQPEPLLQSTDEKVKELLSEIDALTEEQAALRKEREAQEAAARAGAQQRVTVFGARLDDDVAGSGILDKERQEDHERLFESGVKLMTRGEYSMAVTAFTRATAAVPGGLTGRKGGQYAIYLAQALQAADRKQQAVGLLKRCEAHPDKDIRKIADSVLYVMQAPELKLSQENFVSIPKLEIGEADKWQRRRVVEQKDPPPER